jgi:hypothetical protein
MQNHPTAVASPPSVLDSHGTGPFRLGSSLNFHDSHNIAVESPSSSDASDSTDDAVDESVRGWLQESGEESVRSNGIGRMRRESERTASSSTATTSFRFSILTSSDSMDTNSPEPLIPKIEELDEEGEGLLAAKAGDEHPAEGTSMPVVHLPRKRGRPRKHPLPTLGGQVKIAKGRSKTGCITCRRRKKKCDETKPACK